MRLSNRCFCSPIYVMEIGDVLAFASWPHILHALPEFSRELDPVAVAAYLGWVRSPPERTFFRGVGKLAQRQTIRRGADGVARRSIHWRPGPHGEGSVEGVRAAVDGAIEGRLIGLVHGGEAARPDAGGVDETVDAELVAVGCVAVHGVIL